MGLDQDGLVDYIKHCVEASQLSLTTRPVGGGAIQENWTLEAAVADGPWRGRHEWVLRTDAPSGVAASRSRAEEFMLLRAAFEHQVTVPRPLWLCTDPRVAGQPFYIMEKVPGIADARQLVKSDWTAGQRRAILAALGRELARIHDIDADRAGLSFLEPDDGSPVHRRLERCRVHLDRLPDPQPVLEWGLRWLELNAPADTDTVLCHCDFRTGNIMIADERVTGILDWEFADRGDPVEDLGWFCARCWRFGMDRFEAGGIGDKEDLVSAYEQASGRRVDRARLTYWQIMAEARWGIIALQQAGRDLSGRQPSLELALTGYIVPEMESNLIDAIERSSHA